MKVAAVVLCTLLTGSCGARSVPDSSNGPPDVCARPSSVPPAAWVTTTYPHAAVSLRMPPHYQLKHWDVRVGQSRSEMWRADLFRSVRLDVQKGPAELDSTGGARQEWQQNYARCLVEIGGRQALVERWIGGGTVFRKDGTQGPTYQVQVTWPLHNREYLSFTGVSDDERGQAEALAIAHTLAFR
jgi:hypothetical protein